MNFNLYLDDKTAQELDRTAKKLGETRSGLIRKAVREKPLSAYPQGNPLAQQLQMVSAMIRGGLPTRVYYVQLGGFDTHAGQGGAQGGHGQLLGRFAAALKAFYADLRAAGQDGRVSCCSPAQPVTGGKRWPIR